MPGFAPNYTTKWKLGYQNGGQAHHMVLNLGTGDTAPSATHRGQITAFINALASAVFDDFQWLSSEIRLAGENVFEPTTMPTQPNTSTGLDTTITDNFQYQAGQISFTAYAGAAGRTALYVHGVDIVQLRHTTLSPWRGTTDNAIVAAARAALAAGGFRTSGDGAAAWKQYANLKYNDFHVAASRG